MTTSFATLPLSGVTLPAALKPLEKLATNLWWTWQPQVQDLFAEIEPELWAKKVGPAGILRTTHRLDELAKDKAFVAKVKAAEALMDKALAGADKAWFAASATGKERVSEGPIAYFCAEYAFFEGFNQYAGGLGILAGDHCKEASDLGLPFIAVGLFYHRGFFHQMVDWSGRQEHLYRHFDPEDCSCVRLCRPGTQEPLTVSIPMLGREVKAGVWLQQVGRMSLILLNTNLDENSEADKAITSQLYCNSRSMRLHQETILGVGGVKALRALGVSPSVWHMNEGHSALLLIERLREFVTDGLSVKEASSKAAKNSLITIHTPVPEGNEMFDAELARRLIEPIIEGTSLDIDDLLKLGLGADKNHHVFDMTAFALRHSRMANGVSLLHGRTADKTWRSTTKREVIGVTNGAHVLTWLGPEMKRLFEASGADFNSPDPLGINSSTTGRPEWPAALALKDDELWEAHMKQKRSLLALMERRLREQRARHGEGPEVLDEIASWMEEDGLLIGFARRFAPYKRASLILTNRKKAGKLLGGKHSIQIVFSGKSHPADRGGQSLVEQVWNETMSPDFRGKVHYIEDYDMELGKALTQGVDLWLNNPRRPLEASGTSGMKAAMNGIPNASILDGWWDEGFEEDKSKCNGFAIGDRDEAESVKEQDKRDAKNLYKTLEKEVLPLYFREDSDGRKREWIQVMKQSIATSIYSFSTSRMIRDYWEEMYGPCSED